MLWVFTYVAALCVGAVYRACLFHATTPFRCGLGRIPHFFFFLHHSRKHGQLLDSGTCLSLLTHKSTVIDDSVIDDGVIDDRVIDVR